MKFLGVNLKKKICARPENYKILLREIEKDLSKWGDISYSLIGRINTIKISTLHKLTYTFNTISIHSVNLCMCVCARAHACKCTCVCVWKIKKLILKKIQNSRNNFGKGKQIGESMPYLILRFSLKLQSREHGIDINIDK